MDNDLGQKVKRILGERGFKVNYEPESGVYTPWHGIPVKVVYEEVKPRPKWLPPKTAYFIGVINDANNFNIKKMRSEIHIPVGDFYKRPGQMAASLIHEMGHADLMFFDCVANFGVAAGTIYAVTWKTDSSLWGVAAGLGAFLAYHFLGIELSAEIYGRIRYGFGSYRSLRRLINPSRE